MPLVPVFIFIYKRKYFSKPYLPIFILVLSASIISLYSSIQSKYGINNMPSLHLLTVLEFISISAFYYYSINNRFQRKSISIIGILFTMFSIVNSFYIQNIEDYNTYARGLEAFLVICFSLILFRQMFLELEYVRLEHSSKFWINSAFLIYFACTQFLFLFYSEVKEIYPRNVSLILWDLHAWVCVLYYLLLGVGLWKVQSKAT